MTITSLPGDPSKGCPDMDFRAVDAGDFQAVQKCLWAGADVNQKKMGRTSLHMAAEKGPSLPRPGQSLSVQEVTEG